MTRRLQLSKIYTRGGDKGTTALVGGIRVSKSCLQLESYGTVDELNSHIGVIRTHALNYEESNIHVFQETTTVLQIIQNRLFDLGSILATPKDKPYDGMPSILNKDITFLETKIDAYNENLETLNSFTLPGGGILNAHAHVARTVCRRLERLLVRFNDEAEGIDQNIMKYINRLSDYLFVYSRWVSQQLKEDEFLWERR